MAEIIPFRALQYSSARVPIDKVVTQPYDKISPEMQERYRAAHPNNLVRIIRPASEPAEDPAVTPYARAADLLRRWRRERILEQVSDPSLFAYYQGFTQPDSGDARTRKGFIALVRLEDYANKVIFPHEQTLLGPKKDRLELLRATRTHFGQVFLLYSDPECRVDSILDEAARASADVSVRDEYDVNHEVWRISDARTIGAIRSEIQDKKLVIADGHHRYETALAFRDETRRERGGADAGPCEWVMATLVNMDGPGMTVLPTHRVVSGLPAFDSGRLLERARAFFHVTEIATEAFQAFMSGGRPGAPRVAVALKDRQLLAGFELRDGLDMSRLVPDVSAKQAALDVVVLHRLVLNRCLDISEEEVRGESYIRYVRGAAEAVRSVREEGAQAAFLLNATRLDQIREIAFAGEVLPQKSTDFFPKLLSGLTMYAMD